MEILAKMLYNIYIAEYDRNDCFAFCAVSYPLDLIRFSVAHA
jgi:hypothetical protein